MTVTTLEHPHIGTKWIGRAVPRVEDRRLTTGKGTFVDDFKLPGMCYAAIVRSPYPHARIKRVEAAAALGLTGVVGILTGKEIVAMSDPFPVALSNPPKYYSMATDKARYVGEPVAVVVARDAYTAEDAAELVRVEYDILPPVVDIEAAVAADAPVLHEELGTNVAMHRTLRYGDVDMGFREADVVLEEKFSFPRYTSCPLETYAVVCSYDPVSGILTVYSNFQGPWTMYVITAKALRLPTDRVRFIVPKDIGGGFGIKSSMYPYIALISLAAMKLGVPVKWIETRKEHLMASSCQPDRIAHIKLGAKKDGTLTAIKAKFVDNMGAYVRAPEPGNLLRPIGNFVGPYTVKNVELDAVVVLTNKCPTGPNRGYGCQHLYFSLERAMDLLAKKLGMKPEEIRFRNFIPPEAFPYTTPTGGVYDSGDYPKALTRALELVDIDKWRRLQSEWRRQGRYVGIGVAVGVDPSVSNMGYVTLAYDRRVRSSPDYLPKSGGAHIATVKVEPSGKVFVRVDSNPQGQGHETAVIQVVAQELGVNPQDVYVNADFGIAETMWSVSSGTYSSRFSSVGTSAVALAAREVKEKVLRIAAGILHVRAEDLVADSGYVFIRNSPEKKVSFKHIAGLAHWSPDALPEDVEPGLFASKEYNIKTLKPPDEYDRVNSSGTYGFIADMAVVEVDPEIGNVTILDYVTVHDVGTVINPMTLEGQIHGAFLHGFAGALFEELVYDDGGQLLTSTFIDYLCPTSMEYVAPRVDHIATPSPFTVLGSKGGGESSSETTPVAIANAVSDALSPLGVEIRELPLTPEKLWKLIRSHRPRSSTC